MVASEQGNDMADLSLKQVVKDFGASRVIQGVDLEVKSGEFCVFVGPSGCGKSTLLRMIAGLETTSSGQIKIGDRDVTQIDPAERGVAMVFQTYALYPHMTVAENMGFGLRMNKVPKAVVQEKVTRAAHILKLDALLDRKPKALSGGQRQRVAIGRAIVRDPDVFLFDEPLSNLDAELRVEMRVELAKLHKQIGATMIYVTHDQVEAMTMADKIVVLRDGRVEQVGAPLDLYNNPANRFVAGFIGSPAMNFLRVTQRDHDCFVPALNKTISCSTAVAGQRLEMGIRPEWLTIDAEGQGFTVELVEKLGNINFIHLVSQTGEQLTISATQEQSIRAGDSIGLQLSGEDYFIFDRDSGNRV